MTLTGETNWRWEKFFLQISNRAPLLEGEVDLFISTGEIEKKKRKLVSRKRREGKMCSNFQSGFHLLRRERESYVK